MNSREQFINNFITLMSSNFNGDNLALMRNTLYVLLQDYDLTQHKNLPSNDIVDNSYYVKQFIACKKIQGRSDRTLETYVLHINRFINFIQMSLLEVTTNNVRCYFASMINKCSNSYMDDSRRILNVFFEFLKNEEYITTNPINKIGKIKTCKSIEKPFSDMEIELLRNACVSDRDKAFVDILLSTGIRCDELRQIKISDINFIDRSIIVHGKGNKDRLVYFSARCELSIQTYVKNKAHISEYLFSSSHKPYGIMTNRSLENIINKIGERANVPNVHMHRFRKTFATYMANKNVPLQDIKEMLGHSKLDTTNSYYIYLNMERIKMNHRNNAI